MFPDEIIQHLIADDGPGEALSFERWREVTRDLTPTQRMAVLRELPEPYYKAVLGPIHPNDPVGA